MGGRSWALDPFVVTKHQPSNGQRARRPAQKQVTPGANGLIRNASGLNRGGLADPLPEKEQSAQESGGFVCEADAQINAVSPGPVSR
jgi:hypothetical protein